MNMRRNDPGREAARNRGLLVVAMVLLLAGLFAQITMLARISDQNKQASALQEEILELSARAENLELSINQHHNLDDIDIRARRLGMEEPNETQIRVISVDRFEEDTSTQAAEATGGEKVLN